MIVPGLLLASAKQITIRQTTQAREAPSAELKVAEIPERRADQTAGYDVSQEVHSKQNT